MFSLTKYSIFFFTEFKYRLLYLSFSFIIISIYSINYLNLFLILFLKPIEYLNLDLSFDLLSTFLFDTFLYNLYDITHLNNNIIISNITSENNFLFDFYPVFEVNITNNVIYLYLLIYLILLFLIPISFYHIYLFILPGLFKFEYDNLYSKIILFYYSFFFFLQYLNPILIYLTLCFSYNNFYEFFNYEFDIEFDLLYYIQLHIFILILFYINNIIYIIYFFIGFKNRLFLKKILIILNLYFFISIFIYIFFILFFYIFYYFYLFYFFFNKK